MLNWFCRLSLDLYTIDDSLPFILNILLANFVGRLGIAVVLTYIFRWSILVYLVVLFHMHIFFPCLMTILTGLHLYVGYVFTTDAGLVHMQKTTSISLTFLFLKDLFITHRVSSVQIQGSWNFSRSLKFEQRIHQHLIHTFFLFFFWDTQI